MKENKYIPPLLRVILFPNAGAIFLRTLLMHVDLSKIGCTTKPPPSAFCQPWIQAFQVFGHMLSLVFFSIDMPSVCKILHDLLLRIVIYITEKNVCRNGRNEFK